MAKREFIPEPLTDLPRRFRRNVYPSLGDLVLQHRRRLFVDLVPLPLNSAAMNLASLLLHLGVDAGQPPAQRIFRRMYQKHLRGPERTNATLEAWSVGGVGVAATFKTYATDEKAFSSELTVIGSQSVRLQAQTKGGETAEGLWVSSPKNPGKYHLESTDGKTTWSLGRVFHIVAADATRGLAAGTLLADMQVSVPESI